MAVRISGTVFSRPGMQHVATGGKEDRVDWQRIVAVDRLPDWETLQARAKEAGVDVTLGERPVTTRKWLGLLGSKVVMQKKVTLSIEGGREPSDRLPDPEAHRKNDGRLEELAMRIGSLVGVEAQLDTNLTKALVKERNNPPYREAYAL